eukprot:15434912-Alexandrium_andersonii.AAC.1
MLLANCPCSAMRDRIYYGYRVAVEIAPGPADFRARRLGDLQIQTGSDPFRQTGRHTDSVTQRLSADS